MRRIILPLFLASVIVMSCKDKDKKQNEPITVVAEPKAPDITPGPGQDSAAIRTVIMDFYNWYNKNYTKFMRYDLYSSIKKKEQPPYKINWEEVANYQQFIHDSVPQLGEAFVANQKKFFQECDSAFKVDIHDDIPYGFDYDWYTNSQEESQYTLDEINKAKRWVISVNGDTATADIRAMDDSKQPTEGSMLLLTMKKENGQWKIAKIGSE